MPSIQTSLATAAPCRVGRTLPGSCAPGVRHHMPSSDAENPVRANPATPAGTSGSSSAAPSAVSPVASTFTNGFGGRCSTAGNASAARPCTALAVASSAPNFVNPALRM